jgi:hypothetical protein
VVEVQLATNIDFQAIVNSRRQDNAAIQLLTMSKQFKHSAVRPRRQVRPPQVGDLDMAQAQVL